MTAAGRAARITTAFSRSESTSGTPSTVETIRPLTLRSADRRRTRRPWIDLHGRTSKISYFSQLKLGRGRRRPQCAGITRSLPMYWVRFATAGIRARCRCEIDAHHHDRRGSREHGAVGGTCVVELCYFMVVADHLCDAGVVTSREPDLHGLWLEHVPPPSLSFRLAGHDQDPVAVEHVLDHELVFVAGTATAIAQHRQLAAES